MVSYTNPVEEFEVIVRGRTAKGDICDKHYSMETMSLGTLRQRVAELMRCRVSNMFSTDAESITVVTKPRKEVGE